jgi:hypothetical protein
MAHSSWVGAQWNVGSTERANAVFHDDKAPCHGWKYNKKRQLSLWVGPSVYKAIAPPQLALYIVNKMSKWVSQSHVVAIHLCQPPKSSSILFLPGNGGIKPPRSHCSISLGMWLGKITHCLGKRALFKSKWKLRITDEALGST